MITQSIERFIQDVIEKLSKKGDDGKMAKVQELFRRASIDLGNIRYRMRQEDFQRQKGNRP